MSATPTEPIRPSRRRRLFRAFVIGLAVVLSLGAIASWVCTRSWFLEAQIERTLERLLGGDVEIGEVRYEGAGVVMLDEVSVRSREHQGPAAEVLLIEQAKVVIDVDRLMDFDVQVLGVELDGVRLRLSEDQHKAGDFNFMALKPNWQRPYDIEHPLPPYVSITNATIEVGLHDGDRYHVVGTRSVRGEMAPMSEMDRALGFSLTETDPKTGDFLDSGLRIHGRWNVITNEYQSQIEGLELNADTYAMCPAMARFWWDRMQLEGRVSHVNIGWNTARSLLVEFDVEDVGLTLPIETESFWTRYHEGRIDPSADRPRMWVTSGRISLERDQLVLQGMAGEVRSSASSAEVVGVPYEVNLQIFNLPPLDWSEREQWLDGVLAETPFQMSVKLADFKLMRDASGQVPPVDLPMQVAQYLERFHIKEGQLSTEIELTRKQGDADGPAGIQTEGFAYIQKASGAVEAFPYPLDDVESYIQFDNERVTIHFLTGLGSDEAPIRVHGEITPPGENAAIALQITAVHIPLDDRFRSALGPEQQNVFDSLLHRPTAERLSAAGGLPDLASVATATAEYRDLVEELERQRWDEADPTEAQQLELERRTRRVRQLQRVIEAGPFQLGGSVNLELQVTRAAGEGEKASLDGRIDLRRVGLLADRFPYPITITGGTLDLSPKGVVIREGGSPEGASVTTPGGGTGWLTGRIDFVKGEGHVAWVPDLRLQILEDELNPLLYAAIPDVRESDADRSRPSAAEILRDLGLQGSLAYDGWIGKAADRTGLSFAVDIDLHDGFAAPRADVAEAFTTTGLRWPEGWIFDEVSGSLRVTEDVVELRELRGVNDSCRLFANGRIDLRGEPRQTALEVRFEDVSIDEFLLNMVPPETASRLDPLWRRYRPEGSFSADLRYQSGGEPLRLRFTPDFVHVDLDGQPLTLSRREGHLVLGSAQVRLSDLVLEVTSGDHREGDITLDGVYRVSPGPGEDMLELHGRWDGGQFRSPVIGEALAQLPDSGVAEQYRRLEADGTFDGEFSLGVGAGERSHRFTIQPRTLAVTLDDQRIYAEFSPESRVTAEPGLLTLDQIRGRHAGGDFSVEGSITLASEIDVDLQIGYDGRITSSQVQAMLPREARRAIASIAFSDGEATRLEGGRLRMSSLPADPAANTPRQWRSSLEGTLVTRGAAFQAGVPVDEVNGEFQFRAEQEPELPTRLTIDGTGVELHALGVDLEQGRARIELSEDGGNLLISNVSGTVFDGPISGEARIGLGRDQRFEASFQVAGASLALFRERQQAERAEESAAPELAAESAPRLSASEDRPGMLFGGVAISGIRGRPDLLRGRGIVRAIDNVAQVPIAQQVMQLVNLTWPFTGSLDFAEAEFFIAGRSLTFERILFESTVGDFAPLQLIGEGQLDLPSLELDTRFRSRGGWLIMRDVVGGIGDQLYVISVTGPLHDPQAAIIALPTLSAPNTERRWRQTAAVLGTGSTE